MVGPVGARLRVRAGYDLSYTAYGVSDTTTPAFVVPPSTPVHAARFALESERGPWMASAWWSAAVRQHWRTWVFTPASPAGSGSEFERFGASLARSIVWTPRAVGRVEVAWMGGRRLDRFSQFAFGTFDNSLRGYPAVSIRYETGAVVRSVATWNANARLRIDGFADRGIVQAPDETRLRAYPGFGAAAEIPAPFGWLAAVEWGYGVKGINTNGSTGTHVIRISGYKIF